MQESPLGKNTPYIKHYSPNLLFPIPRSSAREKTGIPSSPPFHGIDIWNAYEISWLNPKGKPEIAYGEFKFPSSSNYIVESKSLKLYLNSFNQTQFESCKIVEETIYEDLKNIIQDKITISLWQNSPKILFQEFQGTHLDTLDITVENYQVDASILKTYSDQAEEVLYSNLLKSNCLATGQPDWASIQIKYAGNQIDHESLLKYIISFRDHSGFGEHCVEQIYYDILRYCQPKKLTVYARYTRRGGLDINPFRSNFEIAPENHRHFRQ